MEAIPVPVRARIIKLYEAGRRTKDIADALGYCRAAVRRVRQHFRERGTLDPATGNCGRKSGLTADVEARVRQAVADGPDATLAELRDACGLGVAPATVDRWLGRLGLTRKKKPPTRPSRPGPT
jgi:transposase